MTFRAWSSFCPRTELTKFFGKGLPSVELLLSATCSSGNQELPIRRVLPQRFPQAPFVGSSRLISLSWKQPKTIPCRGWSFCFKLAVGHEGVTVATHDFSRPLASRLKATGSFFSRRPHLRIPERVTRRTRRLSFLSGVTSPLRSVAARLRTKDGDHDHDQSPKSRAVMHSRTGELLVIEKK